MFDENQLVEIKWNGKIKKHYESKGYVFTRSGDTFYAKASELSCGSKIKIEVKCDICGKLYYPAMVDYNHRKNKNIDSCPNCRGTKAHLPTLSKRAKEKFDLLRDVCKEKDYELITCESEYTNSKMYVSYICKKHGFQTQRLETLLRGCECIGCAYEHNADNMTFSPKYVESIINSVNGNILLNPNEYIDSKTTNLQIKCGLCGNIFHSSLYAYIKLNQNRCTTCSNKESKPELQIRKFLENSYIKFEQEKRFDDCKDKKSLPFDFYLPDYNLCIEFDGRQHYEPRFGVEEYEHTKKHDEIKNQYCKDNNIGLLRIPYWDEKNIEKILIKQLNL